MLRFEIFCMRLVEVLFFTGLIGCAVAVVLSWISIFKNEFAGVDKSAPVENSSSSLAQTYRFPKADL